MSILLLVFGLFMFVLLVVLHEFGHFIAARRNGVVVEEFSVGFPPTIYKKFFKNDKTRYVIGLLPLGGYVKLKGEHDSDTGRGTFGAASLPAKVKIMVAGVAMNLIIAVFLLTVVAWMGMPKLLDDQFTVASDTKIVKDYDNKGLVLVGAVMKDSPSDKAGIKPGDEVISIDVFQPTSTTNYAYNGTPVDTIEQLQTATRESAGKTVMMQIKHDSKETYIANVSLNSSKPFMGVTLDSGETGVQLRRSTWSAPIVALGVTKDFTVATMKGLWSAVSGLGSIIAGTATGNTSARQIGQTKASEQVSGPVGIFRVLKKGAEIGFGFVLFIVAIISLTLAIMNVLPIPALDGGRLFVTLLFRLFRKKLEPKTEEKIHGTGFAILMLLFVVITIVDIKKL